MAAAARTTFLDRVGQRLGFVRAAHAQAQAQSRLHSTVIHERRTAQHAQRSLAASLTEHFTSTWHTDTGHINVDTVSGLKTVRSRSRDAAQNNEHAVRFVGMVCTNVIGSEGVRFQSRVKLRDGRPADDVNDRIETSFKRWGKRGNCDVTGRYSWLEVQRLFVQHLAVDGEALLRFVRGRGPFGFQVQLLDPAVLDVGFRLDLANGNRIRQGIEMNVEGKVLAYHLLAMVSGDQDVYAGTGRYIRVPADEILHRFIAKQVNQYRGVPWMAPVLKRLYMTADFAQAGLNKARESAKRGGFITTKDGETPPGMVDPTGTSTDGTQQVSTTQDGQWDTLPEGYEAKPYESNWPNVEYGQMVKDCVRHIASGLHLSYNTLGNDMSDVNYSSARVGVLDEREFWKTLQTFTVEGLHECVGERWLPMAMLADTSLASLNYDRLQTYVDAMSWTPRRWAWVDPLKEIEAAARGIELGLISPQQIIRERGEDPDEVLEDLADWQAATADLFPINGTGGTPANNDPNAAAAQAAADAAATDAGNATSKALAARRRFQLIASRHWDQT